MASRIMQFRYYAEGNANNQPASFSWPNYCTQESFKPYSPINQLGIQTLPGIKIYINSSLTPIIIGANGIFELDVSNTSAIISGLRVDQADMEKIRDLENGYLIIDIVYGEQGD